jgi:hypothetical protein
MPPIRRHFFQMPLINYDTYNFEIEKQAAIFLQAVKSSAASFGISHRSNSPSKKSSVSALKVVAKINVNAIDRLSIKISRTLIYRHKGAGKGVGGSKGSRWQNKFGRGVKTNPNSIGKLGNGKRKPAPFITEAMEGPQGVEKFADIAARELGTAVLGEFLKEYNKQKNNL